MSAITYTYTIIDVDTEHNVMTVKYTNEGYKEYTIGMPLPYSDQTVESVIAQYAPVQQWLDEDRIMHIPRPGHSGTVTVSTVQSAISNPLTMTIRNIDL